MVSELTREKMRLAWTRRIARGEKFGFQKGHPSFLTEEAIIKIADSNRGKKMSDEAKEKIRISKLGNKNPMFGKITSLETKGKIRIALTGKKYKPWSIEARQKAGLERKGKLSPLKGRTWKQNLTEEQKIRKSLVSTGRKHTKESKGKIRAWHIENPNRKFKDTGIELVIQEELITRHILFYKQYPIKGVARVDFFLPELNVVIQCDGCYWHNCLEHYPTHRQGQRIKDMKKDEILLRNGFKVFRFWEHEIKKSAKNCINKITT